MRVRQRRATFYDAMRDSTFTGRLASAAVVFRFRLVAAPTV